MSEVTAEQREEWREDAKRHADATRHSSGYYPSARILALLDALDAAEKERDMLRRGGEELGKSLVFWLELAVTATGSGDCIDEDGDGDYGAVAERLGELGSRAERAEAALARVKALIPPDVELIEAGYAVLASDLRAALTTEAGQ